MTPTARARAAPTSGRVLGIDVARFVALMGMVATHTIDGRTAGGERTLAHVVAGGRASALFAVLAGVSLALMSGGRTPVVGSSRRRRRVSMAIRAVLVAGIGLAIGSLDSGLAVILTYYGVLFFLGLPFVGLRAGALGWWAVVVGVVAPVLSQWLRPYLPGRGSGNPTFAQLFTHPLELLGELTFTGYYPAIPWLAYLLAGMAIGRLDLHRRQTAAALAVAGLVLAGAAQLMSDRLTAHADVLAALASDWRTRATGRRLLDEIAGGVFGSTPTGGSWEWLLVVAPHSATPFDLAHTIGSAMVVIGLALLIFRPRTATAMAGMTAVFGAGAMTLTLYTLHVATMSKGFLPDDLRDSYGFHVLLLGGLGALVIGVFGRGPLEAGVTVLARRLTDRLGAASS